MAIDTFFAYSGVYANVEGALADYDAVHDLHCKAGLIDAYDLKELGEALDAGEAGLVVVAVADMESKIEAAMKHAEKVEAKQLKADQKQLETEAKEAKETKDAS